MQCEAVFELLQKLHLQILCKSIHDTINYSTSICPFESGYMEIYIFEYVEREGKNTKNSIS